MNTNLVVLKTTEQTMSDYTPIYQPIYPLFMGKSQAYPQVVGQLDFKRMNTVGDIRGKHLTPKDTEITQIAVGENKKTFKKYFLAKQMRISALQSQEGVDSINTEVLDEHQKQMDELVLFGEGTSASNVFNNGVFYSADPNYQLENSKEIAFGADEDNLKDMHAQIMVTVAVADQIAGRKVLMIYGSAACAKFDSLYKNSDAPFKRVLQEVLGSNWSVVKMPTDITPNGVNGWLTINMDQIKLNYTTLPVLHASGVNAEKMYAWFNYLMGSAMVEVLAKKAIIRQPVTFAAS